MRRSAARVLMVAGTVALLVLSGCARQTGDSGSVTGGEYVVGLQDVSSGTSVSGTVHPLRSATLTAQVQAKVTDVAVKEGDSVQEGQVLLRLDSRLQDNQLAQAESRYHAAVASRRVAALSGSAQTRKQLEASLTQALAQQVAAQVNLRNFSDKDTSPEQLSNLEAQVAQAEATLRSAENSLASLRDYDTSDLQVAMADFAVQQAELSLSMAQTRLSVLQSKAVTDSQMVQLKAQVDQAQSSLHIAQLRLEESARSPLTSPESLAVLEEQVAQARSSLTVAQSNLDNADSTSTASESDIELQRMQVESAQVTLENAEASYKVAVAGADQKKLQIASAEEQVKQAQSSLTVAQNNLESTRKTVGARTNDLASLQAQVQQADAAVELARANLAAFPDTEQRNALQLQTAEEQERQALLALQAQRLASDNYVITAPWSGTVLALSVSVGDLASPQTSLVRIADTSAWNVESFLDEVDILSVKPGQAVDVTIDSYPDQTFAGTVDTLGRTLTRTPEGLSSYALKIRLTAPPSTMVDGMSADATIILKTAKSVLAVPVESVVTEGGKRYVYVLSSGSGGRTTTTKTEVGVGLEGDDYVEVTSGLKAGDRIVREPPITTDTTQFPGSPFSGGQ